MISSMKKRPASSKSRVAPRMIDVAARAGVSRMAASAVLMGTGAGLIRVGEQTAKRIRDAAEQLGYRPNPAASQLAGRRSGIIAVIGYDWKNYLAQQLLVRLNEAAEERGFRILATRLTDGPATLEQLVREINSSWIDGLVFLAHENEEIWPEVSRILEGSSRSIVAIGDLRIPGVSSVISDVTTGAQDSLRHLAEKGRRRPMFVFEQMDTPDVLARLNAYREVAPTLGMEYSDDRLLLETKDWRVADPEFYPRFDKLVRHLVEDLKSDSIVCDTDFNALAFLRSCRRLGLRAPEDVSIVGWGDLQFSAMFDPAITTVRHDLASVMHHVVKQLDLVVSGGSHFAEPVEVPTRLIVRQSS